MIPHVVPTPALKCPSEDWLHYGSSCYKAYSLGFERSFSEARAYCQSEGGDLMSVGSLEEEDSVIRPIVIDQYKVSNIFWIGLKRKMDAQGEDFKNDYVWTDGTLLDFNHFARNSHIQVL